MKIVSDNPVYTVSKDKNGSTIILYDHPMMHDEECTYVFNKDGSASCTSEAWGAKTELPKDTFTYGRKEVSAEDMIRQYEENIKKNQKNNLNVLA